ncbi:MAG: hypothetical protein ABIH66_12975 [bacterium]
MTDYLKDLVILCACKNGEFAVKGLLSRVEALGIRQIVVDTFIHPESDPGCLNRADDFLRSMTNQYKQALVIFDRSGCGQESKTRQELENEVQGKLSRSGWDQRSNVIVVDPELDIWVWSDSLNVDICLGWSGRQPDVRNWIKQNKNDFWPEDTEKPLKPKEAMEEALREVRKPRSSAVYRKLGESVSVDRCVDPAFLKFKRKLHEWFPAEV